MALTKARLLKHGLPVHGQLQKKLEVLSLGFAALVTNNVHPQIVVALFPSLAILTWIKNP